MAGKGFNRFLELIGIVAEEEDDFDQDGYDAEPPRRSASPRRTEPPRSSGRDDRLSAPPSGRSDYERQSRSDYASRRTPEGASSYRSGSYDGASRYGRESDYGNREYSRQESSSRTMSAASNYDRRSYDARIRSDDRDGIYDRRQDSERAYMRESQPARRGDERGNVVRMPGTEGGGARTTVYYIKDFNECRDVMLALMSGVTVVVNMEDLDQGTVRRCVDTLIGAAFALEADMRRIAMQTWLIAPDNVTVSDGRSRVRPRDDRRI